MRVGTQAGQGLVVLARVPGPERLTPVEDGGHEADASRFSHLRIRPGRGGTGRTPDTGRAAQFTKQLLWSSSHRRPTAGERSRGSNGARCALDVSQVFVSGRSAYAGWHIRVDQIVTSRPSSFGVPPRVCPLRAQSGRAVPRDVLVACSRCSVTMFGHDVRSQVVRNRDVRLPHVE